MPAQRTIDFDGLIKYFEGSCFEYLELEHAGHCLRLCRHAPQAPTPLFAPSVGTIDLAPGRACLPQIGDKVSRDDCLFTIRRFKAVVEVIAPANGSLASIAIERGSFVEFGQPLAAIEAT